MKSTDELARIIWEYHLMHQKLEKADCILVLGSNDLRVAEYAAKLFLDGWAPLLVCSGGVAHKSDLLATGWDKPEGEVFADIAMKMGVPKEKILIENQSTNTGENIRFTRELLVERRLAPKRIIVVQKPYMERRAYATVKREWPEQEFIVTSPPLSFDGYPNKEIPKDAMINIIVGDLDRIKRYGENGLQIPQEISKEAWSAFQELVRRGYTKHLVG